MYFVSIRNVCFLPFMIQCDDFSTFNFFVSAHKKTRFCRGVEASRHKFQLQSMDCFEDLGTSTPPWICDIWRIWNFVHFGVFWGYHHFRRHLCILKIFRLRYIIYIMKKMMWISLNYSHSTSVWHTIDILLMEDSLHQLIWKISHYLRGFIHHRWCRISSINSITYHWHMTYHWHIINRLPSLHPRKLTWNLKMSPWKRRFLLKTIIFRFHVSFRGCINFVDMYIYLLRW